MHWIRMAAAAFLLAGTRAMAAVYGDFYVPDELRPQIVQSQGSGVQIRFPISSSGLLLHLPLERQLDTGSGPLQTIASQLRPGATIHVMNMGGRPWFGISHATPGAELYNGYTHRHGAIYNIALGMEAGGELDAEVKAILARIRILPGLENASPVLPGILDMADRGEWDDAINSLRLLTASEDGEWLPWFLLGEIAESAGDAELSYAAAQRAAMLQPGDAESTSRFAMLESLGGDPETGMAWSVYLATEFPDEPAVWRDMGRAALGGEDGELAMEYFQEALAVNPADDASLYNLTFLAAQAGDYENALRYARDLFYYFPWIPSGTVPDVTSAPGMTRGRVEEILREPFSPGKISGRAGTEGSVIASQAYYPTPQDVETVFHIIHVPVDRQVVGAEYYPVFTYDWAWSPVLFRPWWASYHRRPPFTGWRPGGPGIVRPRPPAFRPPGGPGSHRPRPPSGGNRPGGNRPGSNTSGGSRPGGNGPDGNRPGGNRPRPPVTGGTNRPRPPSAGDGERPRPPITGVRPVPPIGDAGSGTRPVRPTRPAGEERPTAGVRPPGGSLGGGSRPSRPINRPSPGVDRPRDTIRPLPAPVRPPQVGETGARPGATMTRPSRPTPQGPTRPAVRPGPQPQVGPTNPPAASVRPAPTTRPSRPAGNQSTRPAPSPTSRPKSNSECWDRGRQPRPAARPSASPLPIEDGRSGSGGKR